MNGMESSREDNEANQRAENVLTHPDIFDGWMEGGREGGHGYLLAATMRVSGDIRISR